MFERRLESPAAIWGRYGAIVVLAGICLIPIWVMVGTSFKNEVVIFDGRPVWFLFVPTLENYEYILTRGKFDRYLVNSVIVGTASTFFTLFFGGLCAYALARSEFRGRRFVANATLLVRMVPPAVLAVPAFAMVTMFSLKNDLAVLTFFYTALNLPFAIWLLFGFYKQIPMEIEEAAIVDGATAWKVFTRGLLMPLMKSGYAVAGIFAFRIAWNEFILALLLTGRSTRTLPVGAAGFITDTGSSGGGSWPWEPSSRSRPSSSPSSPRARSLPA